MTLHDAQALHVQLVAKLIGYVYSIEGLSLTWGETYRTPQQAALNAAKGIGIAHSLHTDRLAVDFQLFKDGVYLTDPAAYKFMGDYWKTLDPSCCWGGDFLDSAGHPKPDSDHFSIAWGGRK